MSYPLMMRILNGLLEFPLTPIQIRPLNLLNLLRFRITWSENPSGFPHLVFLY